MSDLGTMKARISMDLGERLEGEMTTQVALAIRDAIEEQKREEYWFNVADFTFNTQLSERDYLVGGAFELPSDLLTLNWDSVFIDVNGANTSRIKLVRLDPGEFDRMAANWESDSTPQWYRFWNERMSLLPTPDSTAHIVRGRYLKDLGNLSATYDSGTGVWSIQADSYTTDWFSTTEGERAIRSRATYILLVRYLNDPERASMLFRELAEDEQDLDLLQNKKMLASTVTPFI